MVMKDKKRKKVKKDKKSKKVNKLVGSPMLCEPMFANASWQPGPIRPMFHLA